MKRHIEIYSIRWNENYGEIENIYAIPADRNSWKLWFGIIRANEPASNELLITSVYLEG